MATTGHVQEIARTGNGVVTPRYADRQVLRAEDLSLDRAGHDAELARSRRYLHGWGVVYGLVPLVQGTESTGPRLSVTPGYGVTPSGDEVYLPDLLVVEEDITALVSALCVPGTSGCELPPPDGPPAEEATARAWLVARPVREESDLRAGHPTGCAHPASTLAATRECEGVALELLCSEPAAAKPVKHGCAAATQLLWGGKGGTVPSVVLPAPVVSDDYLVLALLEIGADGTVDVDLGVRHRLVPAWVVQDWLLSCLPSLLLARTTPLSPDPPPEDPTDPPVEGPTHVFIEVLEGRVVDFHPFPVPEDQWKDVHPLLERAGLGGPHRPGAPRLPDPLLDPDTILALEAAGIAGPTAFLAAEPAEVAAATGLDVDAVPAMQAQLAALSPLFGHGSR